MKKLFIMILMVSFIVIVAHTACAEDTLLLKCSITGEHVHINSTLDTGNNSNDSDASVISMEAEYVSEIDYHFEIGLGAKFHLSSLDIGDSVLYIPLYAILNYYPFSIENPVFLTTQLGRNLIFSYFTDGATSDNAGSLCLEIGAGLRLFKYPQVRLEASYNILKGSSYFREEDYYYGNYESDDLPYLPALLEYHADITSSSLIKITLTLGL